jgi:membrane dipeptidase
MTGGTAGCMKVASDPVAERVTATHAHYPVVDCLFVPLITNELRARLHRGGVSVVQHTVGIFEGFRGLVDRVMDLRQAVARLDGEAVVVHSFAEIEAARAENRLAIILGVQSPAAIEDDPRLVDILHEIGIRLVQLTYNERNLVADGCAEARDAGLSAFGRRVVARLNACRMVIDLAHAGERSAREAIDLSAEPVVISHSNARALCDHPRNASDDTIRALAGRGGVIGVNAFPGFVLAVSEPKPTVDDLVDHVIHIASLVGAEHVGAGFDIDEPDTPHADYLTPDGELGVGRHPFPPGFLPPWPWKYAVESVADYPRVTECLLRRGFSDEEARGIVGGNFLRVFGRIWGG